MLQQNFTVSGRLAPVALGLLASAFWVSGCGSSSSDGGDGNGDPSSRNVTLITTKAELTVVSGSTDFTPFTFLETLDGPALVWDSASSSLLLIVRSGDPLLFTDKIDLLGVTQKTSVQLGPLDQIREGSLAQQILGADAVSGLIVALNSSGVPRIFSTAAQITLATGRLTFKMSLPRELTNNQFVAQELETAHLLRFDTAGNAVVFVDGLVLAAAAGVLPAEAAVTGWARGPTTKSLFGRFDTTSNIVKVTVTGSATRYVTGTALQSLFTDVADLRVLDIIADTDSDVLLLLIGDGLKGVALAVVPSDGTPPGVFTSRTALKAVAGDTVDISDLVMLRSGYPVLVDRGGGQVLSFNANGNPVVVGRHDDIQTLTGVASPRLSIGSGLGSGDFLVADDESDTLLLVK